MTAFFPPRLAEQVENQAASEFKFDPSSMSFPPGGQGRGKAAGPREKKKRGKTQSSIEGTGGTTAGQEIKDMDWSMNIASFLPLSWQQEASSTLHSQAACCWSVVSCDWHVPSCDYCVLSCDYHVLSCSCRLHSVCVCVLVM